MYLAKTPSLIQSLFPRYLWKMPSNEKVIYLSFDDGPIPEVTPWVLSTLKSYNAKATFFCVGDNVRKYPTIFERLMEEQHTIGNHTFHHLDAWKHSTDTYLKDVEKGNIYTQTSLFRPPYGHLRPRQANHLHKQYKIVMWDVLSGDFDLNITASDCFKNVTNHAKAGSIIVFHDSLKAKKTLSVVLPKVLEHYSKLGFRFEAVKLK